MDVGQRIKHFRTTKKYSVNKLANLAGISQSYLREIELGNKKPTVEILSYICEALNISLCEFFDDTKIFNFTNDPLFERIYQLNSKQRESLTVFLDSMIEAHNK